MCDTLRTFQLVFLFCSLCHVFIVNALVQVTTEKFRETVENNKYVIVLFYYDTDTCSRCIEAEKEIDKVKSPELFDQELVKVKCDDPGTLVKYGVTTVPQLVFFRGGNPVLYEINTLGVNFIGGGNQSIRRKPLTNFPEDTRVILSEDVEVWLETAKDVTTQTLHEDSFEHLTQASTGATTGDWLVIFYNSACENYLPAIEGAAIQIKQRMNVAKVNTDTNPELTSRFNIKECPTTYFFRLGKMYLYFSDERDRYDIKSLKLFVTSWYKNVKSQKVPAIPTAFEKLTEYIAKNLKEKMNSPKRNQLLILLAVAMGIVAFIISLVVVLCAKRKDVKTE